LRRGRRRTRRKQVAGAPAGPPAARGARAGQRIVIERGSAVAGAAQVGEPAQLLLARALLGLPAPAPAASAGPVRLIVPRPYRSSPPVVPSASVAGRSPSLAGRSASWTSRSLPGRTTVRNRATRSLRARSAPCPVGR